MRTVWWSINKYGSIDGGKVATKQPIISFDIGGLASAVQLRDPVQISLLSEHPTYQEDGDTRRWLLDAHASTKDKRILPVSGQSTVDIQCSAGDFSVHNIGCPLASQTLSCRGKAETIHYQCPSKEVSPN